MVDMPEPIPPRRNTYDPATGTIELGMGADWEVSLWHLNKPGHEVHHGLIIGPPGIGKTTTLQIIAIQALQAERFVLWTVDTRPPYDLTKPLLPAIDWAAATNEEARLIFEAAQNAVIHRNEHGGYGSPSRDKPAILILVDNCESVFNDTQIAESADYIASNGGTAGIGLVVTAEGPDLNRFGGIPKLRSNLKKQNAIAMGTDGLLILEQLKRD